MTVSLTIKSTRTITVYETETESSTSTTLLPPSGTTDKAAATVVGAYAGLGTNGWNSTLTTSKPTALAAAASAKPAAASHHLARKLRPRDDSKWLLGYKNGEPVYEDEDYVHTSWAPEPAWEASKSKLFSHVSARARSY